MPDPAQRPDVEQMVIDDLDTLKVMADSVRLRLLLEMTEPRTVKELAAALDVPQTRLYYHVKLLQKHKLIRVAGRRMVSGIQERSYKAAAESWTVSQELLSEAVGSGLMEALFNLARSELEVALESATTLPGDPESSVPTLSFTEMWFTPEQMQTVIDEMQGVLERLYGIGERGPGKLRYRGIFALYRAQGAPVEDPG